MCQQIIFHRPKLPISQLSRRLILYHRSTTPAEISTPPQQHWFRRPFRPKPTTHRSGQVGNLLQSGYKLWFLCDFLKPGKQAQSVIAVFLLVCGLSGCSLQSNCNTLESLSRLTEKLRGLEFKRPVECQTEGGSIVDRLNTTAPQSPDGPDRGKQAEQSCREKLQNLLFFARSTFTLGPNSELDSPQVRGAYSYRKKLLFISSGLPRYKIEQTVVHELTHALDDQHYDLQSLLQPSEIDSLKADSDNLLARSALVEGDAILSENLLHRTTSEVCGEEYLEALKSIVHGAENPAMRQPPSLGAFRRQFANIFGLAFVCRSAARRDRLFQGPPSSTREIAFGVPAEIVPLPQIGDDIMCSDQPGLASLIYLVGVQSSDLIAAYRGDSAVLVGKAGEREEVIWRIRLSGSPEFVASGAETIRTHFQALKMFAGSSVATISVESLVDEVTVRIRSID